MVVAVGEAIDNGVPEPIDVPEPHPPAYHFSVPPEPAVADSEMLPLSSAQKLFRSTPADVGATGDGTTVTVTLAQEDGVQGLDSHRA